jgi:hypothetical protein
MKKIKVVVIGPVDPGDIWRLPSWRWLRLSTGAVPRCLKTVTALWNAVGIAPVASWLPPGQPTFSSGCPKLVHRVVHSLCAPIVG